LKGRVVELPDGYIGMFDLSSISSHFSACYYPFFATSIYYIFLFPTQKARKKQKTGRTNIRYLQQVPYSSKPPPSFLLLFLLTQPQPQHQISTTNKKKNKTPPQHQKQNFSTN
jgi:hypothetical protein